MPEIHLSAAVQDLAAQIGTALDTAADPSTPRLARAETKLAEGVPLAWLEGQPDWTQYYWADRDGAFEMAGVGEADVIAPDGGEGHSGLFARMRARLPKDGPPIRYYGGFRFHEGPVKGARWTNFAAYRFVVPRFEMLRRDTELYLACNALVSPGDDSPSLEDGIRKGIASLQPARADAGAIPAVLRRGDLPDRAAWRDLVRRTLRALERHDLEKIVLARETCFQTAAPLDGVAVLRRLLANATGTFGFCFHPVADRAFIGAPPERLFKREGERLWSEALAGTRPRGANPEEDAALGEALRHSGKDLREHRIVVDTLRRELAGFCEHLTAAPHPELMRLRKVQHLHTPIEGLLREADMDEQLIDVLHPTPAVGGSPREEALAWIAAEEPFDRGIYAAPVGWFARDAAEFCVAIRSGLVQNDTLTLYNGAGIVTGSTPDEEWAEIESKMGNFLSILS